MKNGFHRSLPLTVEVLQGYHPSVAADDQVTCIGADREDEAGEISAAAQTHCLPH